MIKLWQAIGLQSSEQQHSDLISDNKLQYMTHQFLESCTKTLNDRNINISSLQISKQRLTQFMQRQNSIHQHSNQELSIQIQSCDSQPLNSSQSKINIDSSWNKAIIPAEVRPKFSKIVQKLSSISKQFLLFKDWVRQIALVRKQQTQSAASQFFLISQQLIDKLHKQTIKCTKCESTRAVIDNLTKQCWQLQAKCQQQSKELQFNQQATEVLASKVEACLLTQRGETIAKLKKEVNELRQEKEQLHQMLFLKDNQLLNIQNHYKQNLQLLKLQMEELAQTCHVNIHNAFQQKSAIEAECYFLRNRLKTAEEQLSSQQLQKTLKRTFLTQYVPHLSNDLQATSSKLRPRRVTQKNQQRFRTPQRNGTGMQQDILNQSAHLFNQAQPKKINRMRTDRQFAPPNTHLAQLHRLKNSFTHSPLCKRKEAAKFIQALEVPSSCFDSALTRLEELQKGVRKQISRSKKSNK